MTLTFFNRLGEIITAKQSALLSEYSISYSAPNGRVKRKETYLNGLLQWLDYFREADEGKRRLE